MNRTHRIAAVSSALIVLVVGGAHLLHNGRDTESRTVRTQETIAPVEEAPDGGPELDTSTTSLAEQTQQAPNVVFGKPVHRDDLANPSRDSVVAQTRTIDSRPSAESAPATKEETPVLAFMLKDVGEPFLYHFGLTTKDFKDIRAQGFTLIEGTFDICASDEDVRYFLDSAYAHNLRVVLPAGSGEAEWGFPCDEEPQKSHKPAWERDVVQAWVQTWKDHPALYAWDTSNEAGGNFPFADEKGWETTRALTVADLQTAYRDVRAVDPNHPILIRMNGWYFYDYDENFFRPGNPFGPHVADIVMVNTYSNVEDYYDDFVETVMARADKAIRTLSPETELIIALGAWKESPLWFLPQLRHVRADVDTAKAFTPQAIAFFKYGAKESDWYLPRDFETFWNQSQEMTTAE